MSGKAERACAWGHSTLHWCVLAALPGSSLHRRSAGHLHGRFGRWPAPHLRGPPTLSGRRRNKLLQDFANLHQNSPIYTVNAERIEP